MRASPNARPNEPEAGGPCLDGETTLPETNLRLPGLGCPFSAPPIVLEMTAIPIDRKRVASWHIQ